VFKDLAEVFQATVIGPADTGSQPKPVLADLTLRLIPVGSAGEGYYLSALLNSSPSVLLLHASSAGVQTQRYHPGDLAHLNIPSFDSKSKLHLELADLGKKCHEAAAQRSDRLPILETAVDNAAARLWCITDEELNAIHGRVSKLTKVKYRH
jgi:hypothetical protein